MTDFYAVSGTPSTGSPGASSSIRAEFVAIATAFALLAGYTGAANRVPYNNSAGTGQTNSAGFTFDGTTLTAPAIAVTNGALSTVAASASLFNTGATTLAIGGAATTVSIGAATGTTTVVNALAGTIATDSTSISSGAWKTAGGLGVAKALWVGGLANIAGAVTLQSTLGVTGTLTAAAINASGLVAMAGAATVGTTLGVSGLLTASSGIAVTKATGNSATFTDGSTYTLAASSGGASSAAFGGTAGTLSLILQVNGATAQTLTTTGTTFPGTLSVSSTLTAVPGGTSHFNASGGRVYVAGNSSAIGLGLGYNKTRTDAAQTVFFGATDSATPDGVVSNSVGTEIVRFTNTGFVQTNGQYQIQLASVTKWQLFHDSGTSQFRIYDTNGAADAFKIATGGAVTIPGTLGVTGSFTASAGSSLIGNVAVGSAGVSNGAMVFYPSAGSFWWVDNNSGTFRISSGVSAGATSTLLTGTSTGVTIPGTLGVASGGTTGIGIGTAPVAGNLLLLSGSPLATAHAKFIDTQASGRTWQIGPGQGTATVTEFNIYDTTGAAVLAQFQTVGTRLAGALRNVGAITGMSDTAIPAGGTAGSGLLVSSTANFGVFFGSGAPSLSAAKGSLYLRSDGTTTNNRTYVNTDGGTTWTAVTTAA